MKDKVEGKGVSVIITSTAHVLCSALHKSLQSGFMHPWLFKLCAVAVKGMKLLPFHEEMNEAFIPCLWPKHLSGCRPSELFLIAGKIDHLGALMQPFYLRGKYKIIFPWTQKESDNRKQFFCMQFQSFQSALYPEALHQMFFSWSLLQSLSGSAWFWKKAAPLRPWSTQLLQTLPSSPHPQSPTFQSGEILDVLASPPGLPFCLLS